MDLVARPGRDQHVAQFVVRDRRDDVVDRLARPDLAQHGRQRLLGLGFVVV